MAVGATGLKQRIGKFEGNRLKPVPPSYAAWLFRQTQVPWSSGSQMAGVFD